MLHDVYKTKTFHSIFLVLNRFLPELSYLSDLRKYDVCEHNLNLFWCFVSSDLILLHRLLF